MSQDKKGLGLLYVLSVSTLNVVLATIFSKTGYEAFIAVSIALGVLFTFLTFNALRLTLKSNWWLAAKILCIPLMAFIWFVVVVAVVLSVSPQAFDPRSNLPGINWWIVVAGALPYLLPSLNIVRPRQPLPHFLLHMVVTLLSIAVLFVAAAGFYGNNHSEKNILLVLGMQSQYMMNYVMLKTKYLEQSLAFANKAEKKLRLENTRLGGILILLTVGLPFVIPIILLAGAIFFYQTP